MAFTADKVCMVEQMFSLCVFHFDVVQDCLDLHPNYAIRYVQFWNLLTMLHVV